MVLESVSYNSYVGDLLQLYAIGTTGKFIKHLENRRFNSEHVLGPAKNVEKKKPESNGEVKTQKRRSGTRKGLKMI